MTDPAKMLRWRADHPWTIALTAGMVGLVALSVAVTESGLAATVILAIIVLVGIFRIWFQSSRAFCLTLANLGGIYACVFLFFSETNFVHADAAARSIAFVMPLVAFIFLLDHPQHGWLRRHFAGQQRNARARRPRDRLWASLAALRLQRDL